MSEKLIFEQSHPGRRALAQQPKAQAKANIPQALLRDSKPVLPEVSELQAVRHYTRLSQKNMGIDTHFYPLGSCTMKYNPRGVHKMAFLPQFLERHPLAPLEHSQGFLRCMYDLQQMLLQVTGMKAIALSPMAGAQGEFVGVAMIRAYHRDRNDIARNEIIVPDAAHGTNPASAVMCGFKVRELPTKLSGDIDLNALRVMLSEKTAGIMLTNPSTLGVFEREIHTIAKMVHEVGGLLYYDGANLNAILGKVRPGDMGFDVMHMNLHKTFATPHGGGGPGAGPVAVSARLAPYLPIPQVAKRDDSYYLRGRTECTDSIGRVTTFMGNAGILLRAYIYMRLLGKEGLHRVAEFATLNANYLQQRLSKEGFELAFPARRATHEFIITLKKQAKTHGVTALDFAKRLLDYGFHAPTIYFPLLVPECFLIEPTETECKETLDAFVDAMIAILREVENEPQTVQGAPTACPVTRLDEVKAAKELDIAWQDAE